MAGLDVRIDPWARIVRPNLLTTGDHIAIDPFVFISCALITGDYVHIAAGASITGGQHGLAQLGSYITVSVGCRIITAGEDYLASPTVCLLPLKYRIMKCAPVIMEDFSTLGAHTVVLPGCRLAQGVVMAAGSVVTHDCDRPWTVYAGTPAAPLKARNARVLLEIIKELGYDGDLGPLQQLAARQSAQ